MPGEDAAGIWREGTDDVRRRRPIIGRVPRTDDEVVWKTLSQILDCDRLGASGRLRKRRDSRDAGSSQILIDRGAIAKQDFIGSGRPGHPIVTRSGPL